MSLGMINRSASLQPLVLAVVGCLPLGLATGLGQTQTRVPGAVPYLAKPPVSVTGNPAAQPQPPSSATVSPPASGSSDLDVLKQRDQELATIHADQKRASDNQTKLRQEAESIGDDRRKLSHQLIDTAARIRSVEDEIARAEERVKPLDVTEGMLRQSLGARQGRIGEVLAALQRMGRHPPPALLVRAEDALQSVRSAMLLGAVLPEMQQEAD